MAPKPWATVSKDCFLVTRREAAERLEMADYVSLLESCDGTHGA